MPVVAMMTLALTGCNNDDNLIMQEQKTMKLNFTVGNYPGNGWEGNSRAVGFANVGKTAWEAYDQLLVQVFADNDFTSAPVASTTLSLEYIDDSLAWKTVDEVTIDATQGDRLVARAIYATGYELDADGNITASWDDGVGTAEILESNPIELSVGADGVVDGERVFTFPEERDYSRLRIATEPEATVYITTDGLEMTAIENNSLTRIAKTETFERYGDGDGNIFLYGDWSEEMKISIRVVKESDEWTGEGYDYTTERQVTVSSTPGQGYVIEARRVIMETTRDGMSGINIPMSATPNEITNYLTLYLGQKNPTADNPLELTLFGPLMYYDEERMTDAQRAVADVLKNCPIGSIDLRLPDVYQIYDYAFNYSEALRKVMMPVVSELGMRAFAFCVGLVSVDAPNLEVIGNAAFRDTKLTEICCPEVTSIKDRAFWECTVLEKASFPKAEQIGNRAFWECPALEEVLFPEAKEIGGIAFNSCESLKTVEFPSATVIGEYAFRFCHGLEKAVFPLVSSVGAGAFWYCQSLQELIFQTPVTEWGETVLRSGDAGNITLTLHKNQEGVDFENKTFKSYTFKEIKKYGGE